MEQLHVFAVDELSQLFQVTTDLEFYPDRLQLRYRIRGPLDKLSIPNKVLEPNFQDQLWTTTCLEIFLKRERSSSYLEWNFSPSGHWASYHFASYRLPSSEITQGQLLKPILCSQNQEQLFLEAQIPLPQGSNASDGDLQYGLSAVLHLQSGEKQYWALHHAADKPDFHRPESFVRKHRMMR